HDSAAIVAPIGMSEAEKAVFAQLPPELQAWTARREKQVSAEYTRKTQAVAEQRKAVEAAQTQVLEKIKAYDEVLSRFTSPVLTPPDPALMHTDPDTYNAQLAQYVHNKHIQDAAKAEQTRLREEAAQTDMANKQKYWKEQ